MKEMTRNQVKAQFPDATAEQIDAILNIHNSEIQNVQQELSTAKTERDSYKSQLEEAGKTIQSYQDKDVDIEKLKATAAEWELKHKTETEALQNQLAEAQYGFAAQNASAGLKFTSASARKAFMADLKAAKLTFEDGKLTGFDDYVAKYRESDPDCFQGEKPDPSFSQAGGIGGAPAGLSAAAMAARSAGARYGGQSSTTE